MIMCYTSLGPLLENSRQSPRCTGVRTAEDAPAPPVVAEPLVRIPCRAAVAITAGETVWCMWGRRHAPACVPWDGAESPRTHSRGATASTPSEKDSVSGETIGPNALPRHSHSPRAVPMLPLSGAHRALCACCAQVLLFWPMLCSHDEYPPPPPNPPPPPSKHPPNGAQAPSAPSWPGND